MYIVYTICTCIILTWLVYKGALKIHGKAKLKDKFYLGAKNEYNYCMIFFL